MFERGRVDHVAELVIPAALLRRVWPYLAHRVPQAQRAIANHAGGGRQAARREIAQDLRPALTRLAVTALDGEDHLGPVRERGDQHQQRGLRRLQAGLHVDPVGPDVHGLERGQVLRAPRRVVALPVFGQALHTARTQRRAIAQQPAQRPREVAAGQAVQIPLRQQRRDLRRAALKQRQDPTLKARVEPTHAGTTNRDRAVHQRHLSWLPMTIAIADDGIRRPLLMTAAAEQRVDLVVQHALQAGLHLLTNTRFQRRPSRA